MPRRPHLLQELGFAVRQDGEVLRGTASVTPYMRVPGTDWFFVTLPKTHSAWRPWSGSSNIDNVAGKTCVPPSEPSQFTGHSHNVPCCRPK